MTTMDYNVDNYTIPELLAIVELDDPSEDEIMNKTNEYIYKYQDENNDKLSQFFEDVQTKLLEYTNQLIENGNDEEYSPDDEQTKNWYENEALAQKNNPVQKDKTTERKQKIDVYDNNHVPMNREQLGVNNTYNVPISQDSLNPNLENITTHFINLDSQFRQAGGVNSTSTDYTLDLSDHLTNVLTLRLYSIQIPFTWYIIDYQYGNTCFWITNNKNTFKISIEPGNYTPTTFTTALNTLLVNFLPGSSSVSPPVSYNSNNGIITINLYDYTDPSGNKIVSIQENDPFNPLIDAYFTFFDFTGKLNCEDGRNCFSQNISFNSTLGWLTGFRLPIVPIYNTGNKGSAVLDLNGPKYFILIIDDYNQNHLNNGLISITELSKKLPLPNYYNTSQPYICNEPSLSNFSSESLANLGIQDPTTSEFTINSITDKLDLSYKKTQVLLPSAPRTLTQAQIYTVNEIIKNREKNTSYKIKAPTNSDTFALIPIKKGSLNTGELYVDFSGSLQDNKRVYFGPVDIDRMRVKLLDDKGFIVDLHGVDWCITLISENLYQY